MNEATLPGAVPDEPDAHEPGHQTEHEHEHWHVHEPETESHRLYPSTLGGLLYLAVLAATGVGLVIVWGGDWRLGITWVGAALIAAAAVRLVLRRRDAGMLAVRHRFVDALMLGGVGGVLVFLAESIPNQPL